MKSPLPKVLHPVAGVPMLRRVIESVKRSGAHEVRVVVGHGESLVRALVEPLGAFCFKQVNQNGTADAVRAAKPENLEGIICIFNGDHPLIAQEDIEKILNDFKTSSFDLAVVSSRVKKPGMLGRIVRHKGELQAIVEAKDASANTLKINEVNSGFYVVQAQALHKLLPKVQNHNAQKEYYLTDIISLGLADGLKVGALVMPPRVAFGINSQQELSQATRYIYRRNARQHMENGVVVLDPGRVYIDDGVKIGEASVLYPDVYLKGETELGRFCVVEPNAFVVNSTFADSVEIKAGCYIQGAKVDKGVTLGPYAHLRPGTEIGEEVKIGNFVETKKTKIGARSKASHLTYLGDAEIGTDTNIGCGTITCNYAADKKKYKTKIGNNVFVGSDTQFVAPVEVKDNAIIASGTTVTKNVPEYALAVARVRQENKEGYARRFVDKNETDSEKEK